MKKISYYLVAIVLLGVLTVSYWVYQKYFKDDTLAHLVFQVERGSINETVKVRGEVASRKEFRLEFPFGGTVEEIAVAEGAEVKLGDLLMKLETTDFSLELARAEALLAQSRLALQKLIAGPAEQDVKVLQTKVDSAKKALDDANVNLTNTERKAESDLRLLYDDVDNILQSASTKADDSVFKQSDEMFSDPMSQNPSLNFLVKDVQIKIDAEALRLASQGALDGIKKSVFISSDHAALDKAMSDVLANLAVIGNFLDRMNDALNSSSSPGATTLGMYKTNISTARTNVNAAIASVKGLQQSIAAQKVTNQNSIDAAKSAVNTAQSSLDLAGENLAAATTPARPEDVAIAQAKNREIEAQIAAIKEKIVKSSLRAPVDAKVAKINFETGEVFKPGVAAIFLFALENKVRADISELDIGKIGAENGNEVLISLDAFPGEQFFGKVVFVEPKEIVKEGDKYYRVNIEFTGGETEKIRSGMSADLDIFVSSKENVLKVPELAIDEREDGDYAVVMEGKKEREVKVQTGISDGESIEIISGLSEGDMVKVSTK